MAETVSALTFDIKEDSWKGSHGFFMRDVSMPFLNEKLNLSDRTAVILKIYYAGFCGSDRGIWNRVAFRDLIHDSLQKEGTTRRILGHEFVGEIVQIGSNVSDTLNVGQLVSGDSHITCGTCYQCLRGEENVCVNESILGISTDGVFAEYVKLPSKNLWVIDEKRIRPEVAAIMDPFGNAVHAVSKVTSQGSSVAVFGCGPIGLFSVLLLKHFGATQIIAVDINQENLALAEKLGADEVVRIEKEEKNDSWQKDTLVVKKILELTDGRGVDSALEMAGPASSVNNALESTRRGGHVVLFGLKDGNFTIPQFSRIIVKGLTLHAVIGRHIFATWRLADAVLSDTANGIQEKIWNVILKKGEGTIVSFSDYSVDSFDALLKTYPKIIFKLKT